MKIKIPIEEIKTKIVESGKISMEELETKIKAKINELSGLISESGAAHIIANEYGIKVAPENSDGKRLKIKDLHPGMNGVEILVKVLQKYEVRTFDKGSYSGKVCSLFVADESGKIRFTLWNDQVDNLIEANENDLMLVKGVYVKENNNRKEMHLGRGGSFEVNPSGESMGEVKASAGFTRKNFSDLEGGEEGVEILGTTVQVFDPRFFQVHPETGRRIREGDETEGVTPKLSYVMNLIIDDGTDTMRFVFWKEQVNMLLNVDEAKMQEYFQDLSLFEEEKTDLLGEQFVFKGKVKRNDMFDRLEFVVQYVQKANPDSEIKKLEENKDGQEKEAEVLAPKVGGLEEMEAVTAKDLPEKKEENLGEDIKIEEEMIQ